MTDKIALVTGASRGFGYAAGVELARAGYHIIALARTSGGLEELADAIEAAGSAATLVPLDITDDGGLQRMCLAIHERWGGLDLWLHTAIHATPMSPVSAVVEKDIDRAIAVNLRASQRLIHMVTPLLTRRAGGRAIYLTDDKAGQKFFGSYGATKAAQTALFESWAAETRSIGPRVTPFQPAPMATSLRARFFPGEERDRLASPADEARLMMEILL